MRIRCTQDLMTNAAANCVSAPTVQFLRTKNPG
jgi:hypothetical protein